MPELSRHAVRKEFKAWGKENVIFNLLRHSLLLPTEITRGYYLEDIKKCFDETAINIFEMFTGGCLLCNGVDCGNDVIKLNFLISLKLRR